MEVLKYVLLIGSILFQLLGIVVLFSNWRIAAVLLVLYGVLLIGLFIVLIMERKKEKREEDENDYSDY